MNSKKIIVATLLCLVLVVGLCLSGTGRFSALQSDELCGEWTTVVPAANYIKDMVSSGLGVDCEVEGSPEITYVFNYYEDGLLTLCIETESAKALIEALKVACEKALPEALYNNFLSTQGLTKEETDAYLETLGTDISDLVADSMRGINFDGILTRETSPMMMYYTLKDNKIFYASTAEALEAGEFELRVDPVLRGKTLTLTNAVDAEGNPFEGSNIVKYPLILNRK